MTNVNNALTGDTKPRTAHVELVEEVVSVCGRKVVLFRPPDAEALLDEQAFEREEFLPYWAELWPSAVALARALCSRPLHGLRVLELGCGLALPSIVAALRGAHVLATDWAPDAVRVAALNAERNGVRMKTAVDAWARPARMLAETPWDLVLASDVLYERGNVGLVLHLLPRLVAPHGEVLLADPGRPAFSTFLAAGESEWHTTTSVDPTTPSVRLVRLRRP